MRDKIINPIRYDSANSISHSKGARSCTSACTARLGAFFFSVHLEQARSHWLKPCDDAQRQARPLSQSGSHLKAALNSLKLPHRCSSASSTARVQVASGAYGGLSMSGPLTPGETETIVKALFRVAEHFAPSVVFIDEVDSLLGLRREKDDDSTVRLRTTHGCVVQIRMKNQLMQMMDGISSDDSRMVVAEGHSRVQHRS
eukprot:Polyplicarium_translucidae@DN3158_c0_g1_i2.p2